MFPGWSILGWKCGVYHGNKYALDNGILSMGKSMIFGFRVYDRSEDSRIYCHHLLEAPSLNTIALVTLELLHRPISENNIDYKGRALLAANHNWRQHWKHCGEPCLLGLFPPLFLFISRVLQIFSSNHFASRASGLLSSTSPVLPWLWLSISWMTPRGRSGKEKGMQIKCQVSFSSPWRSSQWSRITLPFPLSWTHSR